MRNSKRSLFSRVALKKWFGSTSVGSQGGSARTFRPSVEELESRLAPSATYVVTDTSDNPTDTGSLRFAIGEANAAGSGTIIFNLPPGQNAITLENTASYPNGFPDPAGPTAFIVTGNITIQGSGQVIQRDASAGDFRLFYVAPTASLTLDNVELSGGVAQGGSGGGGAAGLGGGIFVEQGTLALNGVNLNDNQAVGGDGSNGGGGGGGLDGNGGGAAGGGPNGGAAGGRLGGNGGFGGGGGAGISAGSGAEGGNGGFGGGGGGASDGTTGDGGGGGFGGGGGGAGGTGLVIGGPGGFGGGVGGSVGHGAGIGGGGGGAGLGGAVFLDQGTLSITNSTLTGNTAQGGAAGGGGGGASAGDGYGGAIFNVDGTVTLSDDTIAFNTASTDGGALYNLSYADASGHFTATAASVTLTDSILSNSVTAPDDLVNNQLSIGTTASVTATMNGLTTTNIVPNSSNSGTLTGSFTTSDPMLSSTTSTSTGFTPVLQFTSSNSPAVGGGIAGVTVDQWGQVRPDTATTLGAFEQNPVDATTTAAVTSSLNASDYGQSVTFTATVTNTDGGDVPTGSVAFYDGTTLLGAGTTLSGSGTTATSTYTITTFTPGSYSINAVYTASGNFVDFSSPNFTQTVNQAPLTITADNQTSVYGAALPTLTASYTGFVNGDTTASLTTLPTVTTTATAASHVAGNPYTITASGAVDTDYSINYVPGSLTVTAAPLTITADNQTNVYGAALPTLTASYTGFVNGDTAASLTTPPTLTTTATAASHVAGSPYSITASGAVDADYSISYVPGSLAVTAAPLTIIANNQTMDVGAALPTLTASYTGFVNGDTAANLTTQPTLSTTATASSPVDTYPITASGAVDSDYTISYGAGSLTVVNAVAIATTTLASYVTANVSGYSQTIATTGGIAPITFAVTAGVLPAGLSLNASTGVISGTPTTAGSFTFTVTATDSTNDTASQAYTVVVIPAAFVLNPNTGALTVTGTNFTFSEVTTAVGAGTSSIYTFTIDNVSQAFPDTVVTTAAVICPGATGTAILITNDTYQANGTTQETRESISLGSKSNAGVGTMLKYDANGNAYTFLTLSGFPTSYAYVGRNDGSVLLYGTAGVAYNGFVSAGNYSYISGPGIYHEAQGATSVYGYSAGQATDFAYQYAANAGSAYVVSGTAYSYMSTLDTVNGVTQSYYNVGVGFALNTGVSKNPGKDFAYIIDSPGNDTFVGGNAFSYMYIQNANGTYAELDAAYAFALVFAESIEGGTDTATNSDPSKNILVGFHLK